MFDVASACDEAVLFRDLPFRHAISSAVLPAEAVNEVLHFVGQLRWQRVGGSFYKFDVPADEGWRTFLSSWIVNQLLPRDRIREFERAFECRLREEPLFELQRYSSGSGIGPHTDLGTPEVRWLLNLNTGWRLADGGVWLLANDSTLRQEPKYLPSTCNTGFVFSTGRNTYHARSCSSGPPAYGLVIRIPRVDPGR